MQEKEKILEAKIKGEITQKIRLLNEQEKEDFIINNTELIYSIALKYVRTKIPLEELVAIGNLGMVKGLNSYNKNRNVKISTFIYRCVQNEIVYNIRRSLNKQKIFPHGKKEDSVQVIEQSMNQSVPNYVDSDLKLENILTENKDNSAETIVLDKIRQDENKEILSLMLKNLSQLEYYIISNRFGLGGTHPLTQREIAEKINMSQANVSKLEIQIIDKLKSLGNMLPIKPTSF